MRWQILLVAWMKDSILIRLDHRRFVTRICVQNGWRNALTRLQTPPTENLR